MNWARPNERCLILVTGIEIVILFYAVVLDDLEM